MVINTTTFQVWCYICDDEVAENSSKKLLECVQSVKKEAQKPVLEQEATEKKILAALDTVTPLLQNNELCSVSADIKIKKSGDQSASFCVSLKPESSQNDSKNDDYKTTELLPRVRGLTNLGNTCFFNSMIQNLAQTPFLLEVLKETSEVGEQFELPGGVMKMNDKDEVEVPKIKGELKEWGPFTQALAETLEELQTKSGGVYTPRLLLKQFTTKWPQFAGGDQHDSHEALRHLLESVRSEDLRRFQTIILKELGFNTKIDPTNVENEQKTKIKFYGNQAQERILRPEPVFRGFLVSTLTCQDCNNISPRQETFLDISLPVTTDKPHPPSARRRASPEPTEKQSSGPTKSQLKKEKRAERKSKRQAKNQVRKQLQPSSNAVIDSIDDDNKETENVSSPLSESDADVEDTDDPHSRLKISCDANGNNTESPQGPEKKDDMPENLFKREEIKEAVISVMFEGSVSSAGMLSLTTHMTKVKLHDEAIDEDEKQKAFKNQQMLIRQSASRTRQISHADWSNTLGPRYQCPEGELSVQSCLNHFMSVEYMMGNNKVGCEACTERINGKGGKTVYTNATKQFLISSPPAVLILHLKRFQVGMRGMFRKITKHVEFQTTLDLAPFCASKVKLLGHVRRHQKNLMYSLYGIVEHSGSMHGKFYNNCLHLLNVTITFGTSGGHYVAYVKVRPKLDSNDSRWEYLPKGTKAELDQIDEQKVELEKQAEKVKKRQTSTTKDSDDSLTSTETSSSSSDQEDNVGGSDEPSLLNPPPGKWYYVSDSHVREMSEESVLKAQAYILFYERIF